METTSTSLTEEGEVAMGIFILALPLLGLVALFLFNEALCEATEKSET